MKKTLFDISNDALALDEILTEIEGDITDEGVAEIIDKWILENQEDWQNKADSYCALIRENEARANALDDEVKRVQALRDRHRNRAKALKERLLYFMQKHDMKQLKTNRFELSRAANGGKQSISIATGFVPEELAIISPYRDDIPRFNMDAIREALENGAELDFAKLEPRGEHLRIR